MKRCLLVSGLVSTILMGSPAHAHYEPVANSAGYIPALLATVEGTASKDAGVNADSGFNSAVGTRQFQWVEDQPGQPIPAPSAVHTWSWTIGDLTTGPYVGPSGHSRASVDLKGTNGTTTTFYAESGPGYSSGVPPQGTPPLEYFTGPAPQPGQTTTIITCTTQVRAYATAYVNDPVPGSSAHVKSGGHTVVSTNIATAN